VTRFADISRHLYQGHVLQDAEASMPRVNHVGSEEGNSCPFDVNQQQKALESGYWQLFAAFLICRLTLKSFIQPRIGAMNRKELLRLLLNQARFNGFEFRRWFQSRVRPLWPGTEQAIALLAEEGRHYTLLFSHDFARCFWRSGAHISFVVPSITYPRVNSLGDVIQVTRKPFTRRTIKPDVWKYHLRQMAAADDPIGYLCRFLPASDQIMLQTAEQGPISARARGQLAFIGQKQGLEPA
jgi:hypothetical protein